MSPDRFLASGKLIKQQIDAGVLGKPGLVRIHRWTSDPGDQELLRDVDLALWLMDAAPERVFSLGDVPRVIHLGFADGGMALIIYSDRLPYGDEYQSLAFVGSLGTVFDDDHHNTQLLYRGGHATAIRTVEPSRAASVDVDDLGPATRVVEAAQRSASIGVAVVL